jgi:Domain of unknown function (DUF397)
MEDTVDPRWRKSTRSSGNGGACVEVGTAWRKASYSGNGGDSCVEAGNVPGGVLVRDTTNRGGIVLTISAEAWQEFVDALK